MRPRLAHALGLPQMAAGQPPQLKPVPAAVVAQRDAVGAAAPRHPPQSVLPGRGAMPYPQAVKQAGSPEALPAAPLIELAAPGLDRKLHSPPQQMAHAALQLCNAQYRYTAEE
ncbi:hypothetical protein CV_4111 [Chromobacterium violaceum ATCC 12472]|uniref:Uncharacterized protein n=1 Tax=Chromobacterium violaceum (strain ATCC 12472 / DSM 30191 / JCM 1249 / CCUG 213 / NBRC 12614 / NCIMB 9131 / NCTC 9757 / MK) TaxID=243365 RepID=Q7NQM6_CHRVO|nr:hypothetical protein CV_4111 [Chromobacterium violaceum ATCC 12472]